MSGALKQSQLDQFQNQGFLIVEDVVDSKTIDAVRDEYVAKLKIVAEEALAHGKVSSAYSELTFQEQFANLVNEDRTVFDRLDITLPLDHDGMPEDAAAHTGPAALALLGHQGLLDAVESVIGPEILCNPVQHVRIKPPRSKVAADAAQNSYIGDTNWHQDAAVYLDDAKDSEILTAWVAITDATLDNGCMICLPESHKARELIAHCPGNGIIAENYIPQKLIDPEKVVPMPVRSGGVILLDQYLPHTALPNRTESLRWSFDLRYNPIGQPTGRSAFPGFVARSVDSESILTDAAEWTELWADAKGDIRSGAYQGQVFNQERWTHNSGSPICA